MLSAFLFNSFICDSKKSKAVDIGINRRANTRI